ncbi:MAG: hypothetical protein KJN59_10425 [Bacteroidia bacterium]|nr:hypothetical protein [Bacteroidia bacterium]
MPLEVIEFYKTDSLKENNLMQLVKQYALTQFDSGKYTIPQQKVQIGEKVFFTDSVKIEVRGIVVDTTKQKLYDIKPLIEVDRSYSGWWKILLLICLLVALVAGVIYWFFLRKKPMTEEEKIAILPPYERAKLALQKLDQSNYLQRKDLKGYYSDLTMIIRQYIDEKVYDHALESTTQELVDRLQLLKDGNQVDLDLKTIKNIETVLKRADLVKFAKSRPDQELAKLDRSTVDLEIDHVKEALPEPTEEEKLEDVKYLEELAQKRKRRRIIWSSMLAVLVVIGTYVGFGLFYGFGYMNDTILGHPSKTLLEKKEWVTSEYGAPGVTISTPVVLERKDTNLPVELQGQVEEDIFAFGDLKSSFYIMVSTTKRIAEAQGPQADEENPKADPIDLRQAAERAMVRLEDEGVQNIIIKNEQFITPNGQEGLKTHGLADIPVNESGGLAQGKYVHLGFSNEQVLQQIVMTWRRNDTYAEEMVERILSSIELLKIEEEE